MLQLPLRVHLRERSIFETYFVGPNIEVYERLRSVAAGDPGIIWVWGAPSSGRTHLLQAACAATSKDRRASYLPLLDLINEGPSVLEGSEKIDLLCLDNLDTLVGNRVFEINLFSVFCSFEERASGLIVCANHPPAGLHWVIADISSRFSACEIFQLKPLSDLDQISALCLRANSRGLDLPVETARYLLRRFPRDMQNLGRLLDDIDLASLSAQRRLTVPFVRELLGEL